MDFKLLMSHNNIVKFSEGLKYRNLLKACFKLPSLLIPAYFEAIFFTMGKMKLFDCFKTNE